MLLPLRRLPGLLRRSLSTAASRPAWAMIYRISSAEESARGASLSLAPPPLASRVAIPRQAFGLDPLPASTDGEHVNFFSYAPSPPKQGSGLDVPRPPSADGNFINVFGSSVLAASGDGLLLLGTYRNRASAFSLFKHQLPSPVPRPFRGVRPGVRALLLRPDAGRALRLQPRHRRDGPPPGLRRHGERLLRRHGPPHPGRRRGARAAQEVRRRAAQRARRRAGIPSPWTRRVDAGCWSIRCRGELSVPNPGRCLCLLLLIHSALICCISMCPRAKDPVLAWTCAGRGLLSVWRLVVAFIQTSASQVSFCHVCSPHFSDQARFQERRMSGKTRLWQMFLFVQTDTRRPEGYLFTS